MFGPERLAKLLLIDQMPMITGNPAWSDEERIKMPWDDGRRAGRLRGSNNRALETGPMEISSRSAAAAATQPATICPALELSRASWVVAVHTPRADKIGLHKLKGGDREGLLALIVAVAAPPARECLGIDKPRGAAR